VANSRVCRWLGRTVLLTARSFDGEASLTGRTVTSRQPLSDFSVAIDLANESVIASRLSRVAEAFAPEAWPQSGAGRLLAHHVGSLPGWSRLRLAAWVVTVAALVRAALDFRSLAESGVALSVWVAVLAFNVLLFVIATVAGARHLR
jgi:hypothetical protein